MNNNYKNPVCRGCWELRNNCGTCERCIETKSKATSVTTQVAAPTFPPIADSKPSMWPSPEQVEHWWEGMCREKRGASKTVYGVACAAAEYGHLQARGELSPALRDSIVYALGCLDARIERAGMSVVVAADVIEAKHHSQQLHDYLAGTNNPPHGKEN